MLVMVASLFLVQCDFKTNNSLEDFYFPAEKLSEGLIYRYDFSGDFPDEYWYVKSFPERDSMVLTITVYDALQRQQQISRELRTSSGYVQRDLFLYTHDGKGTQRIDAEILRDDLFPFEVKDSLDVFLYSVRWQEELDGEIAQKRLIRNRRWLGKETLQLMGEEVPVMVMQVQDQIEDEREGTLSLSAQALEYYAEGWGLVAKEQYVGGNLFRSFHLVDTLSMSTFEQMFQNKMNQ